MGKRILVVVSDPDIQRLIKVILESFGYSTDTADNGRTAILQLERKTYSGLLLDLILPAVNGMEVLQQARKLYPALPVVMMTSTTTIELHNQAIAEGAKEVLLYPIDKERLRQVAERWFGPAPKGQGTLRKKAIKETLIGWTAIVVLILLLGYFLSGRWEAPKEEASPTVVDSLITWENCKGNILAVWAAQDLPNVRMRLQLVDDFVWSADVPQGVPQPDIGRLSKDVLVAYRNVNVIINASEKDFLALDQKILRECGRNPLLAMPEREKDTSGSVWSWMGLAVLAVAAFWWLPWYILEGRK